jgi:Putative MetA-pathway of phenol degradation
MHTLPTEQWRKNSSNPRPRLSALAALWLGACGSLPAVALQPLVTDDTDTQGRDGNQLEISFERERVRSAEDRTTRYALPLVYTRGLTDTLDGYIELSRIRIESSAAGDDGRGSGNSAVGFKWRFWQDEARKLSLALKPELQLGVSRASERHGLGNGRTGYAATFIVTRETSFGAIHANLSANRVSYDLSENREANRRTLYRLSVAPVVSLSTTWKAALDIGATTNPERARRARMGYIEPGAIWSPSDDLELALGLLEQVGNGEPSSRTLIAGLTWRF